jgi:hypothetical protein
MAMPYAEPYRSLSEGPFDSPDGAFSEIRYEAPSNLL